MNITRRLRSALQRGPKTLAVTISHTCRDRWELEKGDPLSVYEIGPLMLVFPLNRLPEVQQYRLVKLLEEALTQLPH